VSINKGDEAISLLFPSGQIALDPNGKTELSGLYINAQTQTCDGQYRCRFCPRPLTVRE
jgi:enamine deaminase RidA (YjgF/YER057c/UK114 family)